MKMYIRVSIAVVVVLVVIGGLGTIKGLQINQMIANGKAFAPPPQTVAATPVEKAQWETVLSAVGSLEAVQGVVIQAELAGRVERIAFKPGSRVKKGQLLLQQDVAAEQSQLSAARSDVALTRKNLARAKALFKEKVLPRATLEDNQARYDQALAQESNIQAVIAKKTIRAPFSGRLGLRQVNLGQILETGQAIVTLQTLDPIYVNFQLPQNKLARIKTGYHIRALPNGAGQEVIKGRITAINPEVDPQTRSILVQATLKNPGERLLPGMFSGVTVVLPAKKPVLTIPATAVLHAPYSDSVFLVEPQKGDKEEGAPGSRDKLVLRQQFVRLGEQRGDFVSVIDGLKAGQTVVSTGVFKLRNGQPVVVNNQRAPEFQQNPQPKNS